MSNQPPYNDWNGVKEYKLKESSDDELKTK